MTKKQAHEHALDAVGAICHLIDEFSDVDPFDVAARHNEGEHSWEVTVEFPPIRIVVATYEYEVHDTKKPAKKGKRK